MSAHLLCSGCGRMFAVLFVIRGRNVCAPCIEATHRELRRAADDMANSLAARFALRLPVPYRRGA